jgi:pilus assembly protein Flp/PilA
MRRNALAMLMSLFMFASIAIYIWVRTTHLLDRRGVTSIEYALIAALVAVIIISALTTLGKNISATFNKVASEL